MKSLILLILCNLIFSIAKAQEKIKLDSIQNIQHEALENPFLLESHLPFDDLLSIQKLNMQDNPIFSQPLLPDYTKILDLKRYSGTSLSTFQTYSTLGFYHSPFFTNNAVFNSASYKLNDRISFGGNSFGANSIFDQPKMNYTIQEMSIRGASMFLQYKFSNNFRVETRISISDHKSPLLP